MNYKVYAIQFASREKESSQHFYAGLDPNNNGSMPISYYIWVAVSDENIIVIDTGFSKEGAKARGRTFKLDPIKLLKNINVDSDSVSHVIITHMHWDHIGNCNKFTNAKFVLQEDEMNFWTGKYAFRKGYKRFIQLKEVKNLLEENAKGNIYFVNGTEEILPGITVYKVGGHSPGLQVVKIKTDKGNLVLASDSSHFYQNIQEDIPFPIVHNLADMYNGFDLIRTLTSNPNLIIPGHDPEVMNKFEPINSYMKDHIVRLA